MYTSYFSLSGQLSHNRQNRFFWCVLSNGFLNRQILSIFSSLQESAIQFCNLNISLVNNPRVERCVLRRCGFRYFVLHAGFARFHPLLSLLGILVFVCRHRHHPTWRRRLCRSLISRDRLPTINLCPRLATSFRGESLSIFELVLSKSIGIIFIWQIPCLY